MKALTATLFGLGIGWALLAWMPLLLPFGIAMPSYRFSAHDTASSLLLSTLALTGYCIWAGWGFYTWKGRFPVLEARLFWIASLFNHAGWLAVLPFVAEIPFVEFWTHNGPAPILRIWICVNIAVALIFVFPSAKARADVASNHNG